MTLPVSSYEELLARVRSLTSETIQLRQEITSTLSDYPESRKDLSLCELNGNESCSIGDYALHSQRRSTMNDDLIQNRISENDSLKYNPGRASRPTSLFSKVKEGEVDTELKEVDEQRSSSPDALSNDAKFHRNDWGPESLGLWHSGPSSLSLGHSSTNGNAQQDLCSVVSFTSSVGAGSQPLASFNSSTRRAYSHQQLGAKVEMVYNLLSMLGTNNRNDMSKTLLAMSSSPESCLAMRQSGCLPLLIQLIHSPELDIEVRSRAAEALQNIVHAQTDDKKRRRETRVLKLLQQIREYCDDLRMLAMDQDCAIEDDPEKHPVTAMEALMKFSFDAEHRQAMCSLGGLHAIAELIQFDHEVHGCLSDNQLCITLRRYAGMSLTNLIFGDGNNKALLCSFNKFMRALVSQLMSPSEDLRQVTASVLRNLSWRADSESKQALREIGAVTALMVAAMEGKRESTLKSILSALWNLSAHCSMNKVDVCAVPGAVAFLVKMLKYKAASNTLAVIENAGGILRNVSSHIAIREDYRQILRDNNCFEILLEQLKSPSLTIVSNACGTLWNLSARCSEDQRRLWEMGAVSMLRSLIQSKHKMISMGSSAALKNLLSANPGGNMFNHLDSTAKSLGLQNLPTLFVRKQRALEQELDINISETCENIEPSGSPVHPEKRLARSEERRGTISKRSDSHESVTSTQSDSAYERVNQLLVKNENKGFENKNATMHSSLSDNQSGRKADEQKLIRRYKSSMIPTPAFKKLSQEKKNEKTKDASGEGTELLEKQSDTAVVLKKASEAKEKRGIPILKNRIKPKQEVQGLESNLGGCYSSTNFSSQYEEEFPVNYSLKYSETEEFAGKVRSEECLESGKKGLKEKKKFDEYPDYAETDLDQPTDFSLKYGEETSSDEELKNQAFNYYENDKTKESGYYSGQPESEDTTRTYYTEGTPYEGTPYNFSSSNSMLDLRIDQSEGKANGESSFEKGDNRKLTPEESCVASGSNEKENLYVNNGGDYRSRVKRVSREFESGISTPERPVQYCEEGTPGGCFSRVSSLSSLSGGKEPSNKSSPEKLDKKPERKDSKKPLKHFENEDSLPSKPVTVNVTQQQDPECADQTPLMFSRSSSMNSLSSFEQIHQSIPDDRSSVVSDFSRMTSGIISPSELPDSPTQTVPPSPKQCKSAIYFPGKLDSHKKSVFEDAVATYKQEDTPIEFSRATSLSSLNIENSAKQDFNLKTNSSASSIVSVDESKQKDEKHNNSLEKNPSDDLKDQIVPEKSELEREKLELESVTEVDENILVDCINIGIQENSRRPRPNKSSSEVYLPSTASQVTERQMKQLSNIPMKAVNRSKFHSDSRKVYPTYEETDDAVHTYYTEGTPANVSHAGSHSDLSNLSMMTEGLLRPSTVEDTSDDGSFCSGDTENMLAECIQSGMPKAKHQKEKTKASNMNNAIDMMKRPDLVQNKMHIDRGGIPEVCGRHQTCNDYLRRKDHHLTAKDEVSTFATENSPCNFSVRSSLSDLTVNSVDSPVCLSRPEVNRDQISQALPSGQVMSKPSSSSICMIESDDGNKSSEDKRGMFSAPKKMDKEMNYWEKPIPQTKKNRESPFPVSETEYSDNAVTVLSRHESLSSLSVESFDSSEPTPLEQALLEQCIHSGMPHKNHSKKPELKNYKTYDETGLIRGIQSMDLNSEAGDSSKNAFTSSATVGESTEADEKKLKRVVVGEENAKKSDPSYTATTKKTDSEIDAMEGNLTSSYGGHTWSEDYTSPNENSITCNTNSAIDKMGLRVVGENSESAKDEVIVTNFKIGSEVRDPKFMQLEASKICREIRKYHDFDMSCSMNSEVSQMSCSSYVDSGDFSFIDLSKETGDLEVSESLNLNKPQRKINNFVNRTPTASIIEEPISLPSLGSLKSDLIQDIDLESSMLSVASLTSEVADNSCNKDNLKDQKTPENAVDSPVTVFDRGDDTLVGSDTEIFDDESSIISQENLPLDEVDSKDSTPKRLYRKLTPKEKRQTIQDRYRTYTIHDYKTEAGADCPKTRKITPKERRLNERDRFLTRVLGKENLYDKTEELSREPEDCLTVEDVEKERDDSITLVPQPTTLTGLVAERYNATIKRYEESSKNILPISPAERKEILDNAKLVAICLKTAAQDVDPEADFALDSEAEGSHKTLPIDTTTYNKHTPVEIDYRLSDQDYQSNLHPKDEEEEEEGEDEYEKKGPRILKPGEKVQEEINEAAMKAIRGRRKQIYSSPVKRNFQINTGSMPASPKITASQGVPKKLSLATAKSLPNVPKCIPKTDSPVLCREGTFTKEEGSTVKQSTAKPRSIPVLCKKPDSKTSTANPTLRYKSAPLLRNGKPPTESAKSTRPVSSIIVKNADKPNANSPNLNRHSSGGPAGSKFTGSAASSNVRKSFSSGSSTTLMKNSVSNQSIKSVSSLRNSSNVKSKTSTVPTAKSQSNGSLDSDLNADKLKAKPKTPKKEVTSKIASLWKKVEDTKKKEKNMKDNRVWITAEKETKADDEELVVEKEEIMELSSGKVIRSSTFQALGDENTSGSAEELRKKSHRNSGDFYTSKWQTERTGNYEGRLSAIVPPYNYNPPGAVQPTSPTVKQVDTFHKGSVKVTTV